MQPSMEMIGEGNVMDWLRTGAALLGAVGTVAAVVLALWLQWFRVKRRRPSLTLHFDPTLDRVDVPQRAEDPQEPRDYRSHWLRPRVTNEPAATLPTTSKLFSFALRRSTVKPVGHHNKSAT
jgi:hypothetical protein